MSINISVSKIKLVRESSHRYDISSRKISCPEEAVQIINAVLDLEHEAQEVLCEILLNNQNKVVGVMEITRGSVNASICHPREVFRGAILHNAASIMLFHNHPSGEVSPSDEDIAITERIQKAGDIIDIRLRDHIIVGNGCYTSLKEEGILD